MSRRPHRNHTPDFGETVCFDRRAMPLTRSQRGGLWNSSFADGVHDRAVIGARYLLISRIEVMPRTDVMPSARP